MVRIPPLPLFFSYLDLFLEQIFKSIGKSFGSVKYGEQVRKDGDDKMDGQKRIKNPLCSQKHLEYMNVDVNKNNK